MKKPGAAKITNTAKAASVEKFKTEKDKFFIACIIFLILIFIFTPVYIVQFICLFFIFILACSRIYSWYLANHIRVTRMDGELRVFRHEWAHVELKIENHGTLPAFMLVASDSPGDFSVVRMKKTFCTLFKKSWTLLCWNGLCADRGVFYAGPAVIKGADPLGLFPFRITEKETTKIYVYPSIRSINIKNSRGIPLGNMISSNPLYEDITRYRSLRPYYPGDERRRINWKASAKMNQLARVQSGFKSGPGPLLLVNEFDATASYPAMIFLNVNWDEYPYKNRKFNIERIIEAAAALCLRASRQRQSLGIIIYTCNRDSVIPASASSPIPILEHLAALDYSKPPEGTAGAEYNVSHNSMTAMLNYGRRLSYGTRYIYAGPDLGDEAYMTLSLLKKHHLSLEYLVIDEHTMLSVVPGNSPRYQVKETGYDIV